MKPGTWPVLAVAFVALIGLLAFTGFWVLQQAQRISGEVSTLHSNYQETERILARVRTDVHASGVLVRDYLLDRSELTAEKYRADLREMRDALPGELQKLKILLGKDDYRTLDGLTRALEGYWDVLDPLFEWTPAQKFALSSHFLRREVFPRREAVLDIAKEIRALNQLNLETQQREIARKESELPVYGRRMLLATILLGLAIAGGTLYRILKLEHRTEVARDRAEQAGRELRRLSQQLVKAQEQERKAIARELHDEVGQMLTAQRMELRNLRELRHGSEEAFAARLEDTARLSEEALRSVRDIAMGLRPSMLDDLGLGPAVEWQARDFSRRYGVPVTVDLEGPLEQLPDAHRTCIYRMVQEALTNSARHAQPTEIRIAVHGNPDRVHILVQDDGRGFDPGKSRASGLGLIGMEERVRELNGAISVLSQEGKGTTINAEIPLDLEAAAHA